MAKDKDEFNFDDDIDSWDDFDDPPPGDGGKNRNPIAETARTARRSALDTVFPRSQRDRIILKGMPKAAEEAYDGYKDVASVATDIFAHTKEELVKTQRSLQLQTRQVLPTMKRYLPKILTAPVEKWAKNADVEYQNDYDPNEAAIQRMLAETFGPAGGGETGGGGGQNQPFADNRERDDAAEDVAQDRLKETIKDMKQEAQHSTLIQMAKDVRLTTNLQKGVMLNVQRKALELSYRQLFALQDLTKLTQAKYDREAPALDAIVKNTALPDYAKEEFGEITAALMKRKVAEWISPARYAETFLDNVRDNAVKKISDFFSDTRSISEMVLGGLDDGDMDLEDNSEITPDKQRQNMVQKGVGLGVGQLMKRLVVPLRDKALGKVRDRLEDNEAVNTNAHRGQYYFNNISNIANSSITGEREDGLASFFKGLHELGIVKGYSREKATIGERSGEYLSQVNKFDNRSWITLNEIIPSWLNEINRSIRWGYGEDSDMTYDITRRKFVTSKNLANKARKHIAADGLREKMQNRIEDVIKISDDGTLDSNDRQALGRFIEDRLSTGREFNVEQLLKNPDALHRIAGHSKGSKILASLENKAKGYKAGSAEISNVINNELGAMRGAVTSYQKRLEEFRAIHGDRAIMQSGIFQDSETDGISADRDLTDIYTRFGTIEGGKQKSGRSKEIEDEIRRKKKKGSAASRYFREDGSSVIINEDGSITEEAPPKKDRRRGRDKARDRNKANYKDSLTISLQGLSGVLYGEEKTNFVELFKKLDALIPPATGDGQDKSMMSAMTHQNGLLEQILGHVKSIDDNVLLGSGGRDGSGGGDDGERGPRSRFARLKALRRKRRMEAARRRRGAGGGGDADDEARRDEDRRRRWGNAGFFGRWGIMLGETAGRGVDLAWSGVKGLKNKAVGGANWLRGLMPARDPSKPGLFKRIAGFGKDGIMSGVHGAQAFGKGMAGIADVYNSEGKVVLEAKKLEAGFYLQRQSQGKGKGKGKGKLVTLTRLEDIRGTGPIYNKDGVLIISEEDMKRSGELSYYKGKRWWKLTEVVGGTLGKAVNKAFGIPKSILEFVKNPIKNAAGWIVNYPDMYVPGEQNPRIRGNMMRNGEYRLQATNKVIRRPSDITGAVVDSTGRVIISDGEAKNPDFKLVDSWGRKVRTPLGRMFGRVTGVATWVGRQLKKVPDAISSFFGKDGKLQDMLKNNPLTRWWKGESKGGKWFSENSLSIGGSSRNTNTILVRIYQLLNKRLAGEKESEEWLQSLGGFKSGDMKKAATSAARRARILARRLKRRANGNSTFRRLTNGAFDKFKQGKDWLKAAKPSSWLSRVRDKFQPDRFDEDTKARILASLEGRTDDVAEYYRARLNAKRKFSPRNIDLGLDEKLKNLAENLKSAGNKRQVKNQRLNRNVRHLFKGKRETTDELKQRLLERRGAAATMYRDKLANAVRDMGTADSIRSVPDRYRNKISGFFKRDQARQEKGPDDNNSEKGLLRRIADSMDSMWFDNMRKSADQGGMSEGQTQNLFQRFGRRIKFKENGEQRAFFRFFRRPRKKDFVGPPTRGEAKGKKKRGGMLGTLMRVALPILGTLATSVGSLVGWLAKFGAVKAVTSIARTAGTVASALFSPLAWAGRGLLAAGGAVVTAVGWPVIAAVAAGAAILWGGYKLATRKKAEFLDQMRLAQYGYRDYDLWSSDDGAKALYMEAELKKFVTFDKTGAAILRGLSAKEADRICQGYGIAADDKEGTMTFHAYAQQRFIPVYLRWLTAIRQTEATPKLEDLGDKSKVSKTTMLNIFNRTKLTKDAWQLKAVRDPREVSGGFWSGVWDTITFSGPDNLLDAEEVMKVQDSVKRDIDWISSDKSWFTTPDVKLGNEVIKGLPQKSDLAKTLNTFRGKEIEKAKELAGNKPWRAFDDVIKSNVDSSHFAEKEDLTALESIRMKTYGLVSLDRAHVGALLRLEDAVYEGIDVNSGTWKGNTDEVLDVAFPNIKKDKNREDIIRWFRYRFQPTFLTFCLVLNRYRPGVKPSARLMNGGYLYELGLATSKAVVQKGDFSSSVWSEEYSPFGVMANTDPKSVDKELELLKRLSKKPDLAVRGLLDAENKNGNIDRLRKRWERDSKYSTSGNNLREGWTRDGNKGGEETLTSANPLSRNRIDGSGFVPKGSTIASGGWQAAAANPGQPGLAADETGQYKAPKDMNGKLGMAAMIKAIKDAGINSPAEIALLLANTKHETGGFKRVDENLKYSGERLLAIFPKYFRSRQEADAIAKAGPVAIANRVYGGRMGNNEPGDGWKYRGRGYIQVTGKDNYRMISKATGEDFVNNPDLITSSPEMSAKATIAWWMSNPAVRKLAQNGDVVGLRKKVNGGTIGMADVKKEAGIFLRMAQTGDLDRLMAESAANGQPGQQPADNIPADNESRRGEVVEQAAKREGQALTDAAKSTTLANPAGIKDTGTPPDMSVPVSQAAEAAGQTFPTMSPDEKKNYEQTAQAAAAASAPVQKQTSDSPVSEQSSNTISVQNQQLQTQKLMLTELQGITGLLSRYLEANGGRQPGGAASSTARPAATPTVEHGTPTISNGRIPNM